MSPLPIIQLPREEHEFKSGDKATIRGLSRAEALIIQGLTGDIPAMECHCISYAMSVTLDEAISWHNTTPQDEIESLIDHIALISGLNDDVGKADAEDSPSAKLTELITLLQKLSDSP